MKRSEAIGPLAAGESSPPAQGSVQLCHRAEPRIIIGVCCSKGNYVLFDMKRRIRFQGLKLGGLMTYAVPDEGIYDRILEFAEAVSYLKLPLRRRPL